MSVDWLVTTLTKDKKGIADDPGMVDVFDLETLKKIDTTFLGKQAGGIAFWKMEN